MAAVLLIVLACGVGLSMLAIFLPATLVAAAFGEQALRTAGSAAHWIVSYLSAATAYVLFHAPYAGATAYLYRGLSPPPSTPAA